MSLFAGPAFMSYFYASAKSAREAAKALNDMNPHREFAD